MGVLRSLGKGLFFLFFIAFAFFGYRFAVFMFVPINLRLDLLNPSTEPAKYDIEAISVLTDQFVTTTDGINLHVWTGGNPDPKNVLIFLHGFPESGLMSWKAQVKFFVDKGYYVIIPDMRGYNTSDKPEAESSYHMDYLVADVITLIDKFAGANNKALLVAHDWGALVAWSFAVKNSDRLHKLVILNVPHPAAFPNVIKSNPRQLLKSYYVFFFNFPYSVVEYKITKDDFGFLSGALTIANNQSYSLYDLKEARKMWAYKGSAMATVKYYRANLGGTTGLDPATQIVSAPTIILWGKNDIALEVECVYESIKFCANGKYEIFDNASHFIQHDIPELVNKRIHDYFISGN
jgi:pimeloyl-ACP methyl ester carboxylesterase